MSKEHYHFIGIGGIGMSALVRILLDKKIAVSGSDLSTSTNVQTLIERGAKVSVGHSESAIPPQATVVYSTAVKKENPEYQAALKKGCQLLHRSELLAQLMEGYKTIAIAGTHGKTTSSALLTTVLLEAKMDPTFALGGVVDGFNGRLGKSDLFVAEADESDGSFLNYHPFGAIVTNLEPEHMEYYKSEANLQKAFQTFLSQVDSSDHLFCCREEMGFGPEKGISYGFGEENDLQILDFHQEGWKSRFSITFEGRHYRDIELALLGKHNVLNATAVFGLSLRLGVPEEVIRRALCHFPGVARRCQKRGTVREVLQLDDYAHHPTEIAHTLRSVRKAIGERRFVVLFQPHRYTRTQDHFQAYCRSFDFADHLFVTDIYAAGEKPIASVTPEALIEEIQRVSTVPIDYLPRQQCAAALEEFLRPHDVLITLGAGDITHLHTDLFKEKPPKKFTVGLIFGGLSAEHEISIKSARFVNDSLNRELYDVHHFGIDKAGNWITGDEATHHLKNSTHVNSEKAQPLLSKEVVEELDKCNLFFPVLHGPYGEDGTIQGFIEMVGKPYAGPSYRCAAICMDKVLTKQLALASGVPTLPFVSFGYFQWLEEQKEIVEKIEKELRYPVFVKPVHVGSSIGISKVHEKKSLEEAIDYAFRFDTILMVEEGKEQCRELEFAVIGNQHGEISVPIPGEKLTDGAFVDYEKKYGKNAVKTTLHPDLSPEVLKEGQELARKAYTSTGNSGMTRVDFLLDPDERWWFFEMNPIPGLQPLSLFPKIWARENLPAQELMDRLIILGLHRTREQNRHLIPI
ncbi:MAG: UDP-N-acetylmuramate--L-alanine ligase [Chlamydiae bacterium]|nr:UDP-N-acetylmuramate--L-alanine ligase [Chlamydiota bacterium]